MDNHQRDIELSHALLKSRAQQRHGTGVRIVSWKRGIVHVQPKPPPHLLGACLVENK
eukprot:m.432702 g.432702  ORF g.432702 m.432702 type:complete len:57 (-) comp90062_c0_seq1:235-405(-)